MPKENETASAEAEARGQAIEARARALAETWIAEGVFDDALSEETDADHCARMIAYHALNRFDGIAEKVAQRIRDGAGRLDLVFRHAGAKDFRILRPGKRQAEKGQGNGRHHRPGRSHRPPPFHGPAIPCAPCVQRTWDGRRFRPAPWRPSARDGR